MKIFEKPLAIQQKEKENKMGVPIDKNIILKHGSESVGKALIRDYGDGDIFLTDFVLDPQFRHKGLGKKFMKKMIDKYGVNSLTVNPGNSTAIHIYKSFGFKTVSEPYFDKNAGETVVYMKRF